MEPADYKRVTEVLYLGFVHGTLAALRSMLKRDKGTIIQIGSALSYRSIPLQSAYCGAKHAINGFTDSLRCELHHDQSNVKVTTVQMPAMNTIQFDWVKNRMPYMTQHVPPIFEPELAAKVVLAAGRAKNPRREYWVGSPTVLATWRNDAFLGYSIGIWAKPAISRNNCRTSLRIQMPPNNLYNYVPGKWSARGKFGDRSSRTSAEVFVTLHRHWFALGGLGVAVGLLSLMKMRRTN